MSFIGPFMNGGVRLRFSISTQMFYIIIRLQLKCFSNCCGKELVRLVLIKENLLLFTDSSTLLGYSDLLIVKIVSFICFRDNCIISIISFMRGIYT
jgi:hypothetical protein